jgi:hypothetical protein
LSFFLLGFGLMLAGPLVMAIAQFTTHVTQALGIWLLVIGLVVSRLARKKGIITLSIFVGLLIIASAPHIWFLGVGVMINGILLSQLVRQCWPYSCGTKSTISQA